MSLNSKISFRVFSATFLETCVAFTITHALKKGETVSLIGFGTFSVRHRKARKGRNPKTGSALLIAASQVAGFKAGKLLKEAVQKE